MAPHAQQKPPEISKQAQKVLKRMDAKTRERVRNAIKAIPEGDVQPYYGAEDAYRLRFGDWRIIYTWENDERIAIDKIAPRGDAYKR
ncbi:MAG: type II toxin-antitoxin system RelE/ParE family toxin [Defluviitaleaceae bacterium]|nr:type II toxin-antitoxin system RelE/ParE family toxin [Defluviitaleaceae bacterium]